MLYCVLQSRAGPRFSLHDFEPRLTAGIINFKIEREVKGWLGSIMQTSVELPCRHSITASRTCFHLDSQSLNCGHVLVEYILKHR